MQYKNFNKKENPESNPTRPIPSGTNRQISPTFLMSSQSSEELGGCRWVAVQEAKSACNFIKASSRSRTCNVAQINYTGSSTQLACYQCYFCKVFLCQPKFTTALCNSYYINQGERVMFSVLYQGSLKHRQWFFLSPSVATLWTPS